MWNNSTAFDGFVGSLEGSCGIAVPRDYGDSPDAGVGTATQDYNTAQDDNGARHIRFDSDVDGQIDITIRY